MNDSMRGALKTLTLGMMMSKETVAEPDSSLNSDEAMVRAALENIRNQRLYARTIYASLRELGRAFLSHS